MGFNLQTCDKWHDSAAMLVTCVSVKGCGAIPVLLASADWFAVRLDCGLPFLINTVTSFVRTLDPEKQRLAFDALQKDMQAPIDALTDISLIGGRTSHQV